MFNPMMMQAIARMALTNPNMLAQLAAAKGMTPPAQALVGATNEQWEYPNPAGLGDVGAGRRAADLAPQGPRPTLPTPVGMMPRAVVPNPTGGPSQPGNVPVTQAAAPAVNPTAVAQALGALSQPSTATEPRMLPPVGFNPGGGNVDASQMLLSFLLGRAGGQAPGAPQRSLGQLIGG